MIDYLVLLQKNADSKEVRLARNILLGSKSGNGRGSICANHLSDRDRRILNSTIDAVLSIIGTYSNSRFGNNARQQDAYFMSRPQEHESFFRHTLIAINKARIAALLSQRKRVSKKIETLPMSTLGWDLKDIEPENPKLFINGRRYTHRQLQAGATIYAEILALNFNHLDSAKILRSHIVLYHRGPRRIKSSLLKKDIRAAYERIKKALGPKPRKTYIRELRRTLLASQILNLSDRSLLRITKVD